ncbi:MAG: (Fe-S)-binding protein [Deltaproteobacteria bacterium]|nr:(Fe-S)-binding protein [Deltaproteobacteria bacterium]
MAPEYPENRCKRCGRCMTVCPVYQVTGHEADVARGRLALLEKMDSATLRRSPRFSEILTRCLLCGACTQACANSVPAAQIIQAGRQGLHASHRRWLENPLARTIRKGDLSPRIVSKGGSLLQALFCKRIPDSSGLHLRFPLSFFTKRTVVPPLARRPFIQTFQARPNETKVSTRVAVFVGCGANYLYPEAAWALVEILHRIGVSIVVPRDQGCCGLPAFVSGDTETARCLAKKNIEAFSSSDVDTVLSLCASCGSHWTAMPRLFEPGSTWRQAADALAEKHQDAMAFLAREERALRSRLYENDRDAASPENKPIRVVYHEPCHRRIGQGLGVEAPEALLRRIPGVTLIHSAHPEQCCGHGGTFNLTHFDLSMKILDRRMEDLLARQPNAIVTGCTGCLLQLTEGVSRRGLAGSVLVCHPLVLVADFLEELVPSNLPRADRKSAR